MSFYIGLMSGTSADGIDATLVEIDGKHFNLLATHYQPYDQNTRERILSLYQTSVDEISRLAELDVLLGRLFAAAVTNLLQQQGLSKDKVKAIGSHGQTIRHAPNNQFSYTLQIGDPNIIAAQTNITTVADFRRKDVALGGQGAPLVPAFHEYLWSSEKTNRAIVNIGGIANVTLLPKQQDIVIGFDTGPGNALLDCWIQAKQKEYYDRNGQWAQSGKVHQHLLEKMLHDSYFKLTAPKSTGRDYFNLDWLQQLLTKDLEINANDVQATLAELTAKTILDAVIKHFTDAEILICGGGAYNAYLLERLHALAGDNYIVKTTDAVGLAPEWVEASAFAWLAQQTLHNKPGNLPSVTNAKKSAVLGGIYFAN